MTLENTYLYVKASDLPKLPEGEYYFHQLIGLNALNMNDEKIGVLSEILETGANDVYVIRKDDGSEELVPDVPQFIRLIDVDNHIIKIDFPEWV